MMVLETVFTIEFMAEWWLCTKEFMAEWSQALHHEFMANGLKTFYTIEFMAE
jgi:short-subunit dehydrogenase